MLKARSMYFKVADLSTSSSFYELLLGIAPVKEGSWCHFTLENIRFSLVLNNWGDVYQGSNAVPVFECSSSEMNMYVERAIAGGATVILDRLEEKSPAFIVFKDPFDNEFEICAFS